MNWRQSCGLQRCLTSFLSLLSRLEKKEMPWLLWGLKKRNVVSKKNLGIGFEISTLEIKSKALSMTGLHLSAKVAPLIWINARIEHRNKAEIRKRERNEDKT